jgi:ChrB-like protein
MRPLQHQLHPRNKCCTINPVSIEADSPANDSRGQSWVLVAYRTPKEPSTARVAAWRRLHRLGGLYIGPSVCLIPQGLAERPALDQVAAGVRSAGGTFEILVVEAFAEEAEAALVARFNSARDAEYAEVVERALALQGELRREGAQGKFTFAEVEENEADLGKLRRWLETLGARDVFGAAGRGAAEQAVRDAAAALQRFAERAVGLDEETP